MYPNGCKAKLDYILVNGKDLVSYRSSYKGETAEVRLKKLSDHFATLLGQPEGEDRNPVKKLYRILFRSALMPSPCLSYGPRAL